MYRIAKRLQPDRRRAGGHRPAAAVLITGADVVTGGRMHRKEPVLIERGRVAAVGRAALARARGARPRRVDARGSSLVPGFLDLHTHGAVGVDLARAGREDFSRAMAHYLSRGVTGLLVSIYPMPMDSLLEALDRIAGHIEEGAGPAFGIHLEGPYVSPRRPGALPAEHFRVYRRNEVEDLLQAGRGLVRTMTLAPELPGGHDLARHLLRRGVVPSFGHSDADHEQTRKAIAAGVRHATHLFNAMRGIHHRDPGPVPALLEDGRVFVEIISDGFHVDPVILRLVHRAKHRGRVLLVSDSVAPCGLRDGPYDFAGKPVLLLEGRVTLADGTLAGSALSMDRAVSLTARDLGLPLEAAVLGATVNPACLLGEGRRRGVIAPGRRADLVLLDRMLRVRATWLGGEHVHGTDL
jgi:N-acetylglucosamine-6-phosphate deacetylase